MPMGALLQEPAAVYMRTILIQIDAGQTQGFPGAPPAVTPTAPHSASSRVAAPRWRKVSVVSTRGFTGGFVTYLFDGTRISVPSMSSRPQDSFNYDRIEVLKGPASVLFGEGGIGGAVNSVPKRPDRSQSGSEALIAVGALGSLRLGVGSGGAIDTGGAWRLDVSHNRSDGWVDRNRSELSHLTSGVSFAVNPRLKLEASLDLLHDDIASYWGTPLMPRLFAGQPTDVVSTTDDRVVDRRTIETN